MIFSELLTNLIAILLLTASFSSNASTHTNAKIDSLMTDLHKAIQNREIYLSQKGNHLKELRLALYTAHDEDARFLAMGDLFDEFRPYNTDSAFAYCKQREILALKTGNKDYITNAQLNTASVFGSIGMYKEALEIVDSIQYNTVPEYLLPYYFYIKRTVASYLVDFSIRKEDKERYRKIGNIYQDSLISLCVPGSFSYVINQADKYNSNGQCEKAVAILEDYLANNEYTTHDRAICANTLAWAYQRLGNIDKQKEILLISSIADLQASVREYVSLRQLAVLLFQEGDIENAHEFLQIAMDDAQKCNARLRILEINDIFLLKSQTSGKYYVGKMVKGPAITGCAGTNASISLGVPTSNIDVCAFFHCHTTLHYCPKTTSRRTGPSQNDLDLAQSYNLPGILRDYEGPEITGGHNINESYKDITFGPTKRPDIQYNDVIK